MVTRHNKNGSVADIDWAIEYIIDDNFKITAVSGEHKAERKYTCAYSLLFGLDVSDNAAIEKLLGDVINEVKEAAAR